MQKVVLATGGTGGHIFPALAVADELKARFPEIDILFIGGKFGPEKKLVSSKGYKFLGLPIKGVIGRGLKGIGQGILLIGSMVKSIFYLGRFKPDVVLGFGSYAAFTPVLAAKLLRIKTAIHEQNIFPGVTNRLLGKRVDRVFLSFVDEFHLFPSEKVIITGNPVQKKFFKIKPKENFSSRNLLVVGGSQGATVINKAIVNCLKELKSAKINIWHQTGEKDFEWVKKVYDKIYPKAKVDPFIEDMPQAYEFADLVLCRAGASTIAELIVVKRPSILVPYPYATHDHQLKNARVLEKQGAGMILMQPYLGEINLSAIITDLLDSPHKLRQMANAYQSFGYNRASENIVMELEKLVNEN